MKPQIVPAILVKNFSDLKTHLKKIDNFFPLVQIDICDGKFVKNKTWKNFKQLNGLPLPCSLEFHLMVKNPLAEIKKLGKIKNIGRIYVHAEALQNNFDKILALTQKNRWQLGLALNPETKTEKIQKYLDKINAVLFMTVHPGTQGQKLIEPVLKKIKLLKKTKKLLIAADGGITMENIRAVKKAGVQEFCIGKRLILAVNVKKTKAEFTKLIK